MRVRVCIQCGGDLGHKLIKRSAPLAADIFQVVLNCTGTTGERYILI